MTVRECMKIYVATPYCGENEYEECVASIDNQTYRNFDHFVFENMPEKEAHVTLFRSFVERASEYDFLIKVDADMVLSNENVFADFVRKLEQNKWAELMSVKVLDFFSGQFVWGLNAWRNTVRWSLDDEKLFVDVAEVPSSRRLMNTSELAPAAIHCRNPSPLQAFRYGVHRGLKVVQPDRDMKHEAYSEAHWRLLERVWQNFLRTGDTRVGLAVLGAELAYAGRLGIDSMDYTDTMLKTTLRSYQSMDSRGIERAVRRLRVFNWGVLPGDLRRRLVRALRDENVLRRILHELSLLPRQRMRRFKKRSQLKKETGRSDA